MNIQIEMTGQDRLRAAFVEVEKAFEDRSAAFEEIGEKILSDIRRRLDAHPGPPLAASTIKRKGHARILRDTDAMYASFERGGADNVFRVQPTSAEFGSTDFKVVFHQYGTRHMPKRTIIEITGEQEARYKQIAIRHMSNTLKRLFQT